jgi:hypothetical protein
MRPRRSSTRRVHLVLLGVPVIWGINYAVIKGALLELDPLAFKIHRSRTALASSEPGSHTLGAKARRRVTREGTRGSDRISDGNKVWYPAP